MLRIDDVDVQLRVVGEALEISCSDQHGIKTEFLVRQVYDNTVPRMVSIHRRMSAAASRRN